MRDSIYVCTSYSGGSRGGAREGGRPPLLLDQTDTALNPLGPLSEGLDPPLSYT